jgi:hypothetical protein
MASASGWSFRWCASRSARRICRRCERYAILASGEPRPRGSTRVTGSTPRSASPPESSPLTTRGGGVRSPYVAHSDLDRGHTDHRID